MNRFEVVTVIQSRGLIFDRNKPPDGQCGLVIFFLTSLGLYSSFFLSFSSFPYNKKKLVATSSATKTGFVVDRLNAPFCSRNAAPPLPVVSNPSRKRRRISDGPREHLFSDVSMHLL